MSMRVVDIKNNTESLKDFIKNLEQQADQTVLVTDDGKAVFKISSMDTAKIKVEKPKFTNPVKRKQFGIARGLFKTPEDLDESNNIIEEMFNR